VYDLQTSDRSGLYFRLFAPKPEWSGIAPGCSHPHANPNRDALHTVERQREQLAMAGVNDVPVTDLSWLDVDVSRFALKPPFVLLVPGGSRHRPAKRWPAERYAELAKKLAARGYTVAAIASAGEQAVTGAIAKAAPYLRDLAGQTSFADIVARGGGGGGVAHRAGPMHLIAGAGCPAVVLFSDESDPELCAPRAPEGAASVAVLRRSNLADLAVEDVLGAFRPRAP
jgi:ADP-heptose:LPS heptosyltransferase